LSDTTVLAASVTETPLMTHVKYMLYTTVPSITIALIVFAIAGYTRSVPDTSPIVAFSGALQNSFTISPWLLLVPLATGVMIAKKMPPVAVLFISSLLAGCFAIGFQPKILQEIAGLPEGGNVANMKGMMQSFFGSTNIETGHELLDNLVSTRGMAGMLNTVWLILCAMCFGGVMMAGGMISRITALFLRFMKKRAGAVASTVVSGFTLNMCLADQYIAIILNGEMFKEVYKQGGYESRLLSRSTEDSATVTSVLIPWSSCGMTQATVLGVPTLVYLPYCIFNIVSPFMSIIVATTGYKIFRRPAKPLALDAKFEDCNTKQPE
jgi:NhaC family Na+:H+ antiporter